MDGRRSRAPASGGGAATSGFAGDAGPRLSLERPPIVAGRAEGAVRSGFEVVGWATALHGIAAIEVFVDGEAVGSGAYRPAFPDQPVIPSGPKQVARAEFGIAVPARVVGPGEHKIRVELRDKSGEAAAVEFAYDARGMPDEGPWGLRRKLPQAETDLALRLLDRLEWRPRITLLLLPADEAGVRRARDTLASLRDQVYPDWRLLVRLAGEGTRAARRQRLLDGMADVAERVEVLSPLAGGELADPAILGAEDMALFGLLRAGDELGCDALLEMAVAAGLAPAAEFFYSDERRLDPGRRRVEPYYKPQWSPDLLLSTNYVGRLWLARAALLRRTRASLLDLQRFGEYDLVLRLSEAAREVRHVPLLLCQSGGRPEPPAVERRALRRALMRRGIEGAVLPGRAAGVYRVRRGLIGKPRVSIIIATRAASGLIERCLQTLRSRTAYRNFEIVCIDNIPDAERGWKDWLRQNAEIVLDMPPPFNWSRFNNLAAQRAGGEYLLFLNDDVEIIEPEWLSAMLEHAQRPEVGVVGAVLLYPDRKVQHAGMFLAAPGTARHAFRFADENEPGPFGTAAATRNVIAVTGACMLVRRADFVAQGGFDEAHRIINNDLDYCLRSRQSGQLTVVTPHARLMHHERATREADEEDYDAAGFDRKWRDLFVAGDPYFNPWLATDRNDYAPDREPIRLVHAARPLLLAERVRRILVVKLDYLGDFVTGVAALRRLKEHFPAARLVLLADPSVASLVRIERGIDEVLELPFFYGHSGGRRVLSDSELLELKDRLAPYRFDLAIDLRTRPDTRPLLRCSGASWLAGFEYRGQFPWLDVALEWEGEPEPGSIKRQHISEELLRLVDAVATACRPQHAALRLPPHDLPRISAALRRPYICLHAGAGIETKRWPAERFAELIDLLAANHPAQIVLVGGPDETALAAAILGRVRDRCSVVSLVGAVALPDLPELLAGGILFVGNDSGPKHIAAGLGVPTVAIHGGFGDAGEFGPVGPSAVSIRRDVSCSPCGIWSAAACPRGLACLSQLGAGAVYRACERMLAAAARQA